MRYLLAAVGGPVVMGLALLGWLYLLLKDMFR